MAGEDIKRFLSEKGWTTTYEHARPARAPSYARFSDLALNSYAGGYLKQFDKGIYIHQKLAIQKYLDGYNIAITTPTASGKTLVFNVCALEELSHSPSARVAAIYPFKALASEQASRWGAALQAAGVDGKVGRIDGGVHTAERTRILKESRVLVLTPDIVHAWLLSSIGQPAVLEFLRNLTLIIIDEAHSYTGVFGSNAAFLFRRIRHLSNKLGRKTRFIAASATMSDPARHLTDLAGETFEIVDTSQDSSPRAPLTTILAAPPAGKDLLSSLSEVIVFAAAETPHQSITFVDSRKQTEQLAAIVDREATAGSDDQEPLDLGRFRDLRVYPYRSGYEEEDRAHIQRCLQDGQLRGVVSTSALEMGIDLPHLTLGILTGIPRSATSFYQRIGRVGRRQEGVVLIVNDGSVPSESVFREPERIHSLPLAQSALYLKNERIQYIHAMCLARQGGEDEIVAASLGQESEQFVSPISLPEGFQLVCEAEKIGEIGVDFQAMKAQAGDDPHHTFPLRDLDVQYRVECRQGPEMRQLGSLSHTQLLREAYPGAIYYYRTHPYRVVRVRKHQRVVDVRPERRYFTTPTMLPTKILPNITKGNIFATRRFGVLTAIECAMQIGEAVVGFTERRGQTSFQVQYPLNRANGVFHDAPRFVRYAFTSGVVITHPALNGEQVRAAVLAKLLEEAFLITLPFERQDISSGSDKIKAARDGIKEGQRFVALYDQTYGSLRLTSHLMKPGVMRDVLARACEIANHDHNFDLNTETLAALHEIAASAEEAPDDLDLGDGNTLSTATHVKVLMPGAIGLNIKRDNEEFEVDAVFFSPQFSSLAYRGWHASTKHRAVAARSGNKPAIEVVPVENICPLEGESSVGYYNLETAEISESIADPAEF
jgi:DEAD/DEAH box helicase domain-containing protein